MSKYQRRTYYNESLTDALDEIMLNMHEKIANMWERKTNRKKEDLEKILYGGSATVMGYVAYNTTNIFWAYSSLSDINKFFSRDERPKSDTYEESNSGNELIKQIYLAVYGFGIINTIIGIGNLVDGIISANNESYNNAIKYLSLGSGLLMGASADYISRSKKEKLFE